MFSNDLECWGLGLVDEIRIEDVELRQDVSSEYMTNFARTHLVSLNDLRGRIVRTNDTQISIEDPWECTTYTKGHTHNESDYTYSTHTQYVPD